MVFIHIHGAKNVDKNQDNFDLIKYCNGVLLELQTSCKFDYIYKTLLNFHCFLFSMMKNALEILSRNDITMYNLSKQQLLSLFNRLGP